MFGGIDGFEGFNEVAEDFLLKLLDVDCDTRYLAS